MLKNTHSFVGLNRIILLFVIDINTLSKIFLIFLSAILRYGHPNCAESCMSVRFNQKGTKILALRRRLPPVLYSFHSPIQICQFDHPGYYNSCTMKSCSFAGDDDQYVLSGSDDFNLYMWKLPESDEHGKCLYSMLDF